MNSTFKHTGIFFLFVAFLFLPYRAFANEPVVTQPKIAVLPPANDAFWQQATLLAKKAASDINAELKIYPAPNSAQDYIRITQEASQWADGVLFHDFASQGAAVLELLEQNNIPAILINSAFNANQVLPRQKFKNWIGSVVPDDINAGQVLIQQLLLQESLQGKEIHLLAISGNEQSRASNDRLRGLDDVTTGLSRIKSSEKAYANWDPNIAVERFKQAFAANPNINVVWCASDAMALAVADYIKSLTLTYPPVVGGVDWAPQAVLAVDKGDLAVSVGGHVFDIAFATILMADYLAGYDFQNQSLHYEIPMVAVSQQNTAPLNRVKSLSPSSVDFSYLSKLKNPDHIAYDLNLNRLLSSKSSLALTNSAQDDGFSFDLSPVQIAILFGILLSIYVLGNGLSSVLKKSKADPLNYQFSSARNKKVIFSTVALLSAIFFISTLAFLAVYKDKTQESYASSISATRQSAQLTLEIWANYKIDELNTIATMPEFQNAAKVLSQLSTDKDQLINAQAQHRLRNFVSDYVPQLRLGYFLIAPDFTSIASRRNENIGTPNIISKQHRDLLEKVFSNGDSFFIPPMVAEVKVASYTTAFIVAPVKDENNRVIAAVTMRLDPRGVLSQVLSTGRFGQTGETYAINKNGFIVSQSRFFPEQIVNDESLVTENGIILAKLPSSAAGLQLTLPGMAINNRSSGENVDGYLDYRGEKVIGSWAWNDTLNVVLVSKMDASEAFSSYKKLQIVLLSFFAIFLIITVGGVTVVIYIGDNANKTLIEAKEALEQEVVSRTQALADSEQNFRGMFESSRDALVVMVDEKFIDCNQAAVELYGVDNKESLCGKTPFDNSPAHQPNGESSSSLGRKYIQQAQQQGYVLFEWESLRFEHQQFPCEVHLQPIDWKKQAALLCTVRDITSKKLAERLNRKNDIRLKLAAEAAGLADWEWTPSLKRLSGSEMLEKLVGLRPGRVDLNQALYPRVHRKDLAQALRLLKNFKDSDEQLCRIEFRVKPVGESEYRWLTTQLRKSTSVTYQLIGVCQDITDEKRMQLQLEASKRHAENAAKEREIILNTIPGIVYTCKLDRDWTMLFMSDMTEQMLDIPVAEFLAGETTFASLIHEDDADMIDEVVGKAVEQHLPYTIEYRLRHKDGTYLWVYESGQAFYDENGEPSLLHGTIIDITSRKETEKQFQAVIESAPECMFVVNEQREIVLANALSERLFGYKKEELLGQTIDMLIPEDIRVSHHKNIEDYMKNPEIRGMGTGRELMALHSKGFNFPVEISLSPLKTPDGLRVCAAIRDISTRKEAEHQLLAAKEAAEQATKAKSDFLANMSHEIRTPMNAIIGMSHLAQQQNLPLKAKNYIDKVELSAQSLLGIINDILDFSKIEAGKLDIENIDFNLNDVLVHFSNTFALKAAQKGIELLIDVPADVPLNLIGDPLRLKQILLNLGSNAIKFTEQGDITLHVSTDRYTRKSVMLKFDVADTGIGMTDEQQEKLFQAFSQADSSTTRKYGGTGLGLTISKNLIELMGGAIGVTSEHGKGTTFSFTCELGLSTEIEVEKLIVPEHLASLNILIVDDSEGARIIVKDSLEQLGYHATAVSSAATALEAVAEKQYDLIFVDWMMPDIDGLTLAKTLNQELADEVRPKIVMMTSYDIQEMADRANHESIAYQSALAKPTSPSNLYDSIIDAFSFKATQRPIIEEQVESWKHLANKRILLVEDNLFNQELAQDLLEQESIIVTTAENGQVALDMLEPDKFDLVLMDCQMPIMDGFTATQLIREQAQYDTLPIIAMTANVMQQDVERTRDVGMNDHIGKPIEIKTLFTTLTKWLTPELDLEHLQANLSESSVAVDSIPHIDGLNTQKALASLQGNIKLFNKLLVRFAETNQNFLADYQQGDLEERIRLAHSLKGTSANLGANAIASLAGEIEEGLPKAADITDFDDSAEHLDRLLNEVIEEITTYSAQLAEATANESVTEQAQSLSDEEFKVAIEKIIVLVDNFDSTAADSVEELIDQVSIPAVKQKLNTLYEQLSNYDFDAAMEILETLR